ncbi:hydrogenase nickel incorporation protein HypB [Isoptericola sp. b490]|uniref:hydrogenase nickel incorporation protein HypB n=1 Tax=Actinotalea lenta TaxID=3064654 RepID=UPI002713EE8D|nr:hydrogenase nickel incorporation protein HypB [Isoptericola sp. b490]MDO8120664.1 hydrogenase nickel incorporation protein HypB [Isoptericola sp. b490]
MCDTCGCGATDVRVVDPGSGAVTHTHDGVTHTHQSGEAHSHDGGLTVHTHEATPVDVAQPDETHEHPRTGSTTVELELDVLGKNDALAAETRAWLAARDLVAVNLMSSPGSGKTTLLERTIREATDRPVVVVEGDQETLLDAERIRAAGARAVQVNTGAGCHLDAEMFSAALDSLAPEPGSLVMVENVGNLVCPALFDLGERARVVVISVTEGDDKPLKYPHMFSAADLVVLNKIDLLPYVDFDVHALTRHARALRPGVRVLPVSARTGEGLGAWYGWLAGLHS